MAAEHGQSQAGDGRTRPPAFTLVEMLIVMAIIVLSIMLAIPAIRALTGSRSEEAAQNTVASYLASVRADAVGLQEIDGVIFYIDPGTNRITMQEVAQSVQPTDPGGIVFLDLEAGVHPGKSRDALALPPGIGLMTIKDTVAISSGLQDPFRYSAANAVRYLGYNYYPPSGTVPTVQLGGVILFDGNGRLYTGRYGFRFLSYLASPANPLSQLGQLVYPTPPGGSPPAPPASDWPPLTPVGGPDTLQTVYGQTAFVLYDRQAFLNQRDTQNHQFKDYNYTQPPFSSANMPLNSADGVTANQQQQPWWLDTNTTMILINRYDGTLVRAE